MTISFSTTHDRHEIMLALLHFAESASTPVSTFKGLRVQGLELLNLPQYEFDYDCPSAASNIARTFCGGTFAMMLCTC
jgi:hypothetical protein